MRLAKFYSKDSYMNKEKRISRISLLIVIIVSFIVLLISIRGLKGNPNSTELNNIKWTDNGPFELSPERGRFALLYSIVEDHSLHFSLPLASFASPDVAVANGSFVSLFAPGVSVVSIPGFIIGKLFGISQVGTFATIALFAFMNVLLIRSISIRLGANPLAASIGSLTFLFATPAYAYAVTMYEHHISLFLILMSIYLLLLENPTFRRMVIVWFLLGLSILVDYPNILLIAPIALYTVWKYAAFSVYKNKLRFNFYPVMLCTVYGFFIPVGILLLFNFYSHGNALQLSGSLETVKNLGITTQLGTSVDPRLKDIGTIQTAISSAETKAYLDKQVSGGDQISLNYFNTRNLLNGLYIYFFSPDRGMFYFTPVMFLGILSVIFAYKKKVVFFSVLIGIISINILLYSMWGDPWGGWAFGSRYLIPSYGMLSIFIALLLTYFRKDVILLIIFSLLLSYSVAVNTVGALTSSRNPPQIEVLSLESITKQVQKYTVQRNFDLLLNRDISKSFVFQTYLKNYLSASQFYVGVVLLILFTMTGMTVWLGLMTEDRVKTKI